MNVFCVNVVLKFPRLVPFYMFNLFRRVLFVSVLDPFWIRFQLDPFRILLHKMDPFWTRPDPIRFGSVLDPFPGSFLDPFWIRPDPFWIRFGPFSWILFGPVLDPFRTLFGTDTPGSVLEPFLL